MCSSVWAGAGVLARVRRAGARARALVRWGVCWPFGLVGGVVGVGLPRSGVFVCVCVLAWLAGEEAGNHHGWGPAASAFVLAAPAYHAGGVAAGGGRATHTEESAIPRPRSPSRSCWRRRRRRRCSLTRQAPACRRGGPSLAGELPADPKRAGLLIKMCKS